MYSAITSNALDLNISYQCVSISRCHWPFIRNQVSYTFQRSKESETEMTYIIAEPCVGIKDGACIDVCPVDCIYTREEDDMMYINPDECIDCAACEPVCPETAIFVEDEVPDKWSKFTPMNYDYFKDKDLDELAESTATAPRQINQ